jgi:DNA replication protein DnaC
MQRQVVWINVGELADRLRETFSSQNTSFAKRFEEIRTAELLVLDHFKMPPQSHAWSQEKLFQLVDYRYLTKLPTIITKFGDNIQDLSPEFQSRFADKRLCEVLLIKAPDYRGGLSAKPSRPDSTDL